jgi:hypothetical protein
MAKKNKASVIAILGAMVCFFVFTVGAQEIYNLKVPTSACKLVPNKSCFNTKNQKSFDVGSEVTSLDNLYTFCTQVSSLTIGKPARIILVLDASGSMCQEVTSCAGATRNDPADKRIEGAKLFVDSIAKRCGNCEVGVVVYTGVQNDPTGAKTISSALSPLKVTSANITTIKAAITDAACAGGLLGKTTKDAKLEKRALTFTGMALDSALKMVDVNYSAIADSLDRHVVLLTDGDWQVPTTQTILNNYASAFPGRQLPTVHSVFISDSAAHVAAGFPPQGAVTCTRTDTVDMDLSNLKLIADRTHGLYFPGSTPQTIASTFNALFVQITRQVIAGLSSVEFIDSTTNETRQASFTQDTGNHFIVQVPVFELKYGRNKFSTIMTTKDSSGNVKTERDTFSVFRHDTPGTGATSVFTTECLVDTVNMNIHCKPNTMLISEFDTVTAKVAPQDTDKFVPNNVVVRAFVPFPDGSDTRIVAQFHFDDKTLANTAPNGLPGTGSPSFSSDAAFGNAISSGSFTTNLPLPISGDFTFECWIRPGVSSRSASIASAGGFSFGVADGYLIATIGATTIRTTNAIDTAVWQHVAIARINGSANLYINGIPMAVAASAAGSISGAATIGNFSGGALDEVRVSTFVSTNSLQGKTLLQIPTANNLLWNIKQVKSASPSGILPPDMWQGKPRGQLQFQSSNTMYGPVIINFFDTLSSPQLMWSKNGDPVFFWATGVLVSATLKDTSHDGHLDLMDIKWEDDITIKTVPDVSQFITTLQINTLDGNKDVTLHASSIVSDPANKTFHVILAENQEPSVLETGWSGAAVILSEVKITVEGKWFIVSKVIDGADPIPKSACYGTTPAADTLRIFFSEPIEGTAIDMNNLIRIDQNGARNPLSALDPQGTIKSGNMLTILFRPNTIQALVQSIEEIFPGAQSSPRRVIDYCIGPTGINVEATLRDTSHDGHLDLIDIAWTDNITIKTVPDASQFIVTLQIKTLDGNKDVKLHASSIVSDPANKTFHVILAENQDQSVLETGWSSATITLTEFKITNDSRWFVVNNVIDGADPIPKSACYGFTSVTDTLNIYFSEPIEGAAIDLKTLIRIDQEGVSSPLSSLAPKATSKSGAVVTIVFNPKTIQPGQTIEEIFPGDIHSPGRAIDYCHGGPVIDRVLIGPNPYTPGSTMINGKPGLLIRLDLFIPSKIAKGTYTIFDAVGNVLADQMPMGPDGAYSLSIIWDGKNKKGMNVAGGTYLLRATAENILTGQSEMRLGKIGIKTVKK